jgi:hypothetical protein
MTAHLLVYRQNNINIINFFSSIFSTLYTSFEIDHCYNSAFHTICMEDDFIREYIY